MVKSKQPKHPDYKYWQELRAKSVKKWRDNYKPKPIPKRTKKREKQEREYSRLRNEFLEQNKHCARCNKKATQVHHVAGRVGGLLTDVTNFLPVCSPCHIWITENSKEAIELGLSKRRNT